MPANRAAIERHFTQPPDERGETCEWCYGRGGRISPLIGYIPCVYCNGTGTIDPADAAEAEGERWADDAWEALVDRELGL